MRQCSSALFLPALLLAGCSLQSQCDDAVTARVPSPYGRNEAVVFARDCGATTGDNLQLWVGPRGGRRAGAAGNALVLDALPPGATLTPRWIGDRRLRAVVPPGARIVTRTDRVGDIAVLR